MKRFLKILATLVLVVGLIIAGGLYYLMRGLNEKVELNGVLDATIEDGLYVGNYSEGRWTLELEVTIKNSKITSIDIIDDVTFVRDGVSQDLFDEVIANQDTQVDVVAGATRTSNAYLKAIEDALNKGE